MPNTTVTVSIGRNRPNAKPLSLITWGRFQERVGAIVQSHCNNGFRDIHFTGTGQGRWVDADGVRHVEDSFTIVATIDEELHDELKARLSIVAEVFGQDAIAFTAGTTQIVEAR